MLTVQTLVHVLAHGSVPTELSLQPSLSFCFPLYSYWLHVGSAQGFVKLSCCVFSVPVHFSVGSSFQVLAFFCFYTGFKRLISMCNKDVSRRLYVDVADFMAVNNSALT